MRLPKHKVLFHSADVTRGRSRAGLWRVGGSDSCYCFLCEKSLKTIACYRKQCHLERVIAPPAQLIDLFTAVIDFVTFDKIPASLMSFLLSILSFRYCTGSGTYTNALNCGWYQNCPEIPSPNLLQVRESQMH